MSRIVLIALNWDFSAPAIAAAIFGLIIGWLVRGIWETGEDAAAARREFKQEATRALGTLDALRPKPGMPDNKALVPSIREMSGSIPGDADIFDSKLPSAFHNRRGEPLPARAGWGDLPYEELAPMFLDQFLLRYFASLLEGDGPFFVNVHLGNSPWNAFILGFPWAKEMPLLFEQLTGYKLNDRQLNEAIGEYISRLEKSQRAATPGQRETQTTG